MEQLYLAAGRPVRKMGPQLMLGQLAQCARVPTSGELRVKIKPLVQSQRKVSSF